MVSRGNGSTSLTGMSKVNLSPVDLVTLPVIFYHASIVNAKHKIPIMERGRREEGRGKGTCGSEKATLLDGRAAHQFECNSAPVFIQA